MSDRSRTTREQGVSVPTLILGIETSCDETAAAIIDSGGHVCASIVSSQHDVHRQFGGVVPELASRSHMEQIEPVVEKALQAAACVWSDLGAIAVTQGPGLAGALLVGVSYAKSLAYALRIPLVGVNHLDGHIASAWIDSPRFPLPCVLLVVSGGHTHLYRVNAPGAYQLLGRTLDDAAGEAFDKGAQMLGLDYPGGPAIDKLAQVGDRDAFTFPRSHLKKGSLDFSFSGLKTALLYFLRRLDDPPLSRCRADVAASYQEAIVDVLAQKAFAAVHRCGVSALAVVGGVSANSRLRAVLQERAAREGILLELPPLRYCTDNAAMIAAAGRLALVQGRRSSWELEACPRLELAAR